MADPAPVIDDLTEESTALERLVSPLPEDGWATPTPAPGWTIAHQIAHLAWTDQAALLAVTDPQGYARHVEQAVAAPDSFVDDAAAAGAKQPPADLLDHWRASRTALREALLAAPAGTRVPWYGPPMSVASMATARLMETWAHGQDVADALGVHREPSARLRHIAHIGVRTRDFAYVMNGLTPPGEPFRVELTAPGGEVWTYGPEDAPQKVTGPALDFCLLVTRRRHRADVAVTAAGADADAWLDIAQAFAGPAGPGRAPGQFA